MSKQRSLIALDWLNFFMADVETGIGPFVAAYFSASRHWNPAQIGILLGTQSLASVLTQTPAGWVIDRVSGKKWLIAGAALVISVCALLIVGASTVPLQFANQFAIGMSTAFVAPAVAAISLGLVGREAFSRRVGRNGAFSHSGNVVTALFAGYLGYAAGQQWIFYSSAGLGAAAILTVFSISSREIDNNAARALPDSGSAASIGDVLRNASVGLFLVLVTVFHVANAMLPLAGQELARVRPGTSPLYMSACIVTAQTVMVPVSLVVGRVANRVGRKPILIVAFIALALRGLLFSLGANPFYIVAIEALDGIGTAIASVAGLLVISDLAKGTGRFNLMQGMFQASVGVGAFLGNSLGGVVAKSAGFPVAFGTLAATALVGSAVYGLWMPETIGEERAQETP